MQLGSANSPGLLGKTHWTKLLKGDVTPPHLTFFPACLSSAGGFSVFVPMVWPVNQINVRCDQQTFRRAGLRVSGHWGTSKGRFFTYGLQNTGWVVSPTKHFVQLLCILYLRVFCQLLHRFYIMFFVMSSMVVHCKIWMCYIVIQKNYRIPQKIIRVLYGPPG